MIFARFRNFGYALPQLIEIYLGILLDRHFFFRFDRGFEILQGLNRDFGRAFVVLRTIVPVVVPLFYTKYSWLDLNHIITRNIQFTDVMVHLIHFGVNISMMTLVFDFDFFGWCL